MRKSAEAYTTKGNKQLYELCHLKVFSLTSETVNRLSVVLQQSDDSRDLLYVPKSQHEPWNSIQTALCLDADTKFSGRNSYLIGLFTSVSYGRDPL